MTGVQTCALPISLPGAAILFGLWMVFTKSRRWVEIEGKEGKQELSRTLSEEEENLVRQDLERFRQS